MRAYDGSGLQKALRSYLTAYIMLFICPISLLVVEHIHQVMCDITSATDFGIIAGVRPGYIVGLLDYDKNYNYSYFGQC